MRAQRKITIGTALVFAITLAAGALPAAAVADVGTLRGPMAAIAKARAAADAAEARAGRHDAEAVKTVDDASREAKAVRPETTLPGAADQSGPRDRVSVPNERGAALPTYDARAHRDPFQPPRLNATADARTPLQTYQLGQLKLVGVVRQLPESGYRAMVEDSAGLGYIITTGTPIGSSGGVVRSIELRRVVIEESTRDFYGDVKPKQVVMELPQEDRSP
jgi:Tfp pilus assembly protein PilP